MWGAYGVLRGFSPQGSLTKPQDGLVTPPLWELRADLFKKRPKF